MNKIKEILDHYRIPRFFLVKDYTVNYNYIVDTKIANYLFGGYCGILRSDCIFSEKYFRSMHITADYKYFSQSVLFFKDPYATTSATLPEKMLKDRINEMKKEQKQNINVQTREKTPEEIKESRTVRLVGCYHSLDKAIQEFKQLK